MKYTAVVGRNISGARGRLQISQTAVAARMQEFGFSEWRQQTVAKTEKGNRRLAADELLALSLVLKTPAPVLLAPVDAAGIGLGTVQFPAELIRDAATGSRATSRWP